MKIESACARSLQLSRSAKHGAADPWGWGPAAVMKERARRARRADESVDTAGRQNRGLL